MKVYRDSANFNSEFLDDLRDLEILSSGEGSENSNMGAQKDKLSKVLKKNELDD